MSYRTIRVRTEESPTEAFHVRIPDAAVLAWLGERANLQAHGYPDRPPDVDTLSLRAWIARPGEERLAYITHGLRPPYSTDRVFPIYTATWHTPGAITTKVIVTGYGDGSIRSRVVIDRASGERPVNQARHYEPMPTRTPSGVRSSSSSGRSTGPTRAGTPGARWWPTTGTSWPSTTRSSSPRPTPARQACSRWSRCTDGLHHHPIGRGRLTVGAPDEAEIRAHVLAAWHAPRAGRLSLAGEFADAFGTVTAAADGLWAVDDFRPSEADRYDALLSGATVRARRIAEAELLDAVIDALVAFALACPDAPRERAR